MIHALLQSAFPPAAPLYEFTLRMMELPVVFADSGLRMVQAYGSGVQWSFSLLSMPNSRASPA